MAESLKALSLPLEGTHHRGHDDAWNIARILGLLLKGETVKAPEPELPLPAEDERTEEGQAPLPEEESATPVSLPPQVE